MQWPNLHPEVTHLDTCAAGGAHSGTVGVGTDLDLRKAIFNFQV